MTQPEVLRELLGIVGELIDQVEYNASADDLQSSPTRNRQIEAAAKLRTKLETLRSQLPQAEFSVP